MVFGARRARVQKARPVRRVPVIVEEKGRSVVPFSAFILRMDRECEVEDNAFSGKQGINRRDLCNVPNSGDADAAPERIMHDPQSSTNENAERPLFRILVSA